MDPILESGMGAPFGVFPRRPLRSFRAALRVYHPIFVHPSVNGDERKETPMAMSMAKILIHSHAVSPDVRSALQAAEVAPVQNQAGARKAAARLLLQESSIDCRDARELVDLAPGSC